MMEAGGIWLPGIVEVVVVTSFCLCAAIERRLAMIGKF